MKRPVVPIPASLLQADAVVQKQREDTEEIMAFDRLLTPLLYEARELWESVQGLDDAQVEQVFVTLSQRWNEQGAALPAPEKLLLRAVEIRMMRGKKE